MEDDQRIKELEAEVSKLKEEREHYKLFYEDADQAMKQLKGVAEDYDREVEKLKGYLEATKRSLLLSGQKNGKLYDAILNLLDDAESTSDEFFTIVIDRDRYKGLEELVDH